MNVLSLFDGMSCGQIALERAGINIDNYYSSEIDKYASKVCIKNYPKTIQLGNINNWPLWDMMYQLPKIDLVIGGSPCQGFSFAGKQLNFDDPRSKLFFEFVKILKAYKPKYFLLENVKMKKEFQDIISGLLEVEPVEINSNLVSAQNRKRLYWTNIPGVGLPGDKGILLKDIIEGDLDSDAIGARIVGRKLNSLGKREDCNPKIPIEQYLEMRKDDKSNCLTTVNKDSVLSYIKMDKRLKVKFHQNKSSTLTGGAHSGGNHSDMDILVIQKPRGFNKGGVKSVNGKTPTLSSCSWEYNNHILQNNIVRRFSPIECERLQTVPDNYTKGVSNSQRYKMLGNGWTVDVISHIFKGIKE